ncbi:MAG: aminotransferase class I/II-fold pyridoxal phosphate-dependent enzyme [Candidatus Solibacter usitatus]|nr:aminotransferase class I/II-fold pyridoxal phosphate-dependent enzyme [Candidatus Solibacter usitatus]
MKMETIAVHAGRKIDKSTGAVAPPLYLTSTYERGADGKWPLGYTYAREEQPNRESLEKCLAALEGGTEGLAFGSGLAVVAAALQGMEPGDHMLFPDDVYHGLRKTIGDVFAKSKLETTFVDMTDTDAIQNAVRPNTRLIWVETPSNPMLKLCDLTAIAGIARKANAISIADNTFATPVLQRPLDFGIDMVMHSTTKYIGGHSDVVGGALITRHDNYLFERARKFQKYGGAVPSAFDCWLLRRSIDTLPLRVRQQSANALAIARWLQGQDAVDRVHYPGLPEHPRHDLACRQMSGGFGGMLSFQVKGAKPEAMAVVARAKLFTRATSLGGTHSLIEHRASVEGPKSRTPQNLIRLSAGIENAADLIADLEQALRS